LKDRLREFGQTPLLLWMLCGLFRQTGQIPANLGEVFRAFTQGYEKHLKADVPVELALPLTLIKRSCSLLDRGLSLKTYSNSVRTIAIM
jgi:predicted NACHT family NTPase